MKIDKRTVQKIEEMADLMFFCRLLIYDTDLPNDEKIEKIGNAIDMFYDKYGD